MTYSKELALDQFNDSRTLTKYQMAGDIATKALDAVISMTEPGVSVRSLCEFGDNVILEEVEKVFTKDKTMSRGIAFPTSVAINNMAGYYSPDDDNIKISEGDIVNIELGVHFDGFPATVGYTLVVNTTDQPLADEDAKRARVVNAVVEAAQAAFPLMKAGNTNKDVVRAIQKVAEKYECNLPIVDDPEFRTPGLISYQMSQNVLDGSNEDDDEDVHQILLNRESEKYNYTMRETELEENQVYAVDIVMSTGNGKLYPTEERVTIFRRDHKNKYSLKLKASRMVLKYFTGSEFPKTARGVIDSKFKMGVGECTRNGLLIPYAPFAAYPGEYVAQSKFTVVVRKKKPILITGRSSDEQLAKLTFDPPVEVVAAEAVQIEHESDENDTADVNLSESSEPSELVKSV